MQYRLKHWFTWRFIVRQIRMMFTHNMLSKVVALLVALLLYMLTTGEKNVVTNMKLRLEIVTPEGLIVTNPEKLGGEIIFNIKGPRARVQEVVRRHEVLTVDLAGSRAGLATVKIHPEMLKLPPGVEVTGISPSEIEPRLAPLVSKSVKVKLALTGEVASGYRLLGYEVKPPETRVRGSATALVLISEIETEPIQLQGLTETMERDVGVVFKDSGVFLDSATIFKAYIRIEPVMRGKTFDNIPVSVLTRYKAGLQPPVVKVKVVGPELEMKSFSRDGIKAEIDLSKKDIGIYRSKVNVVVPPPMKVEMVLPPTVRVHLK